MLNKEFKYFKNNRGEIIKDHLNEFVAIKDCEVKGYFKMEKDAMVAMKNKGYELGSFIIQKCVSEEEGRVMFYTRRVAF